MLSLELPLHKKWSFLWRISSENVTKCAVSCGFGHIYWGNTYVKRHFLFRVWAILMLDILILTPFGTHLVEEDLNISSVINCLFPS